MPAETRKNPHEAALESAILELYDKVCAAFSRADLEAAAGHFSDDPGMVKISNGHVSRGKSELLDYWQQRIGNQTPVRIRLENIVVHGIDERHAWATADEYLSIDGGEHQAVVSNLFVLEDGRWKIMLDHTTWVTPVE